MLLVPQVINSRPPSARDEPRAHKRKASVLGSSSASIVKMTLPFGDTVTCRVTRINPRLVNAEVLCVGNDVLREPCTALLMVAHVLPPEQQLQMAQYVVVH